MKLRPCLTFVSSAAIGASVFAVDARPAEACGGCFVSQSESTQVSGHRMALSLSNDSTSLWDQIEYAGNPSDFAWVLPIKGIADLGLSSDVLFQVLEQSTAVTVLSPQITCPPPPDCGFDSAPSLGAVGSSSSGDPGVTVIAQEVVGPYATVQLKSDDPNALKQWLLDNGYNLPADIAPVIDAYVAESFNFLALKLVPGQGVSSMRPVRVTTQGAAPVLPLRMVAAGTGAITPITLWVLGEGRYEPKNFPSFQIAEADLVWDWDAAKSNYAELKDAGFTASQNKAWLVEAGEPTSSYVLTDSLTYTAQYDPVNSGYGEDESGANALEHAKEDVVALLGDIDPGALTLSRVTGQLSRKALAVDLLLEAAADQSPVPRVFQTEKTVGTAPSCPPIQPCSNSSSSTEGGQFGAGGGFLGGDFDDLWGNPGKGNSGGGGCALGGTPALPLFALAALGLASARARRRARQRGVGDARDRRSRPT